LYLARAEERGSHRVLNMTSSVTMSSHVGMNRYKELVGRYFELRWSCIGARCCTFTAMLAAMEKLPFKL
jgi:hypothetical protein